MTQLKKNFKNVLVIVVKFKMFHYLNNLDKIEIKDLLISVLLTNLVLHKPLKKMEWNLLEDK